ncbi:MAG TPA: DUF302 domain-containing protein [Sporichthyaceae bacterium]|jgi:uncharacterized protein (DUF302 family)|nr:DUF302 domain-containing protein [Sporichthyaceae bacterium]
MNDSTADAWSADGINTTVSTGTVGQTLERLLAVLDAKGLTVFTVIDHSGAAAAAGLTLRDTKVVIFGSPRAGTPIMAAAPLSALDLPLRVLIVDDAGTTRLAWTRPEALGTRHRLGPELVERIAGIDDLVAAVAVGPAPGPS